MRFFPNSLRRALQFAFLLALGMPTLFLIRLAYDYRLQSQATAVRERLDYQSTFIRGWLGGLNQYSARLREIGAGFARAGERGFPSNRDPRLWIGVHNRPFRYLEKHPEQGQSFRRAYLRFRTLYNRVIIRSVASDPSTYDDFRSPLKSQFFALEHSHLSPKASYYGLEDPPLKGEIPQIQGSQIRSWVQTVPNDLRLVRQRNEWLVESGKMDLFSGQALVPVIYTRSGVTQLLWDEGISIARNLIRILMFTENVAIPETADLKDLLGMEPMESQSKWLPMKFYSKELEIFWQTVPRDWTSDKFLQDKVGPPQGIYIGLLDVNELVRSYYENFRLQKAPAGLRQLFDPKKGQSLKRSEQEQLLVEAGRIPHGALLKAVDRDGLRVSVFRPADGAKPASVRFHWNQEGFWAAQEAPNWPPEIRLHSVLGVLNETNGTYSLGPEVLQTVTASKATGFDLLNRYLKKVQRPVQFLFEMEGSDYIGTLHPAQALGMDQVLVFEPLEPVLSELQRRFGLILGGILLFLILAFLGGRILSLRTTRPVLALADAMSVLGTPEFVSRLPRGHSRELQSLISGFQRMSSLVENRLWQMRMVQLLQDRMQDETPVAKLLDEILSQIQQRYDFSVIGSVFFKGSRPRREDWILKGPSSDCIPETVGSANSAGPPWRTPEGLELELLRTGQVSHESLSGSFSGWLVFDAGSVGVRQVLSSLLEQMHTAILKAYLEELREDTSQGWEIQESFMPQNVDHQIPPEASLHTCFQAARGLAGDYLDLFTSDFEDLVLSIADVSGKGIGPSLFGATARAAMRVLASESGCPGTCLEALNGQLVHSGAESLFLTMFLARIDFQNHRLHYASAGHNRMFLVRRGGLIPLSAKGLPSGMFEDIAYESKAVDLWDQDLLVLYTDGITEQENAMAELYGEQRFEQFLLEHAALEVATIAQKLDWELQRHRAGVEMSDDVTYILLRYARSKGSVKG